MSSTPVVLENKLSLESLTYLELPVVPDVERSNAKFGLILKLAEYFFFLKYNYL